ncbi:hypothetical protein WA026_013722, partial [Henosepilachna vigintioctopunctata]
MVVKAAIWNKNDDIKSFNIVPVAQRIARWTSNPKVVGSIPARDAVNYFDLHYTFP